MRWTPRAWVQLAGCLAVAAAIWPASTGAGARAASDPGGDGAANLRLPPRGGKLLGVNGTFELSGVSFADFLTKFDRAGFNSVRRTLSWWHVEPARDRWDELAWGSAEAFYGEAVARGMTPVFNIGFAPPWARRFGDSLCGFVGLCEFPPTPAMNSEWAEFAAEAARRFPRATFEIWNEPNTTDFWESGPNPERWAELVVIAHDAIKAVDRRIPIIVCGCAGNRPSAWDAEGMEIGEFLRRAYEHTPSIRDHHDGISFHFYPQGYHPFEPYDFGRGSHLADIIWRVRHVAASHGDRGVDLWVDEVGYWTADGPEASGREVVSENGAARGLARLTRRLLTIRDVKAVMVHREVDGPGGEDRFAVRDASFGLLRRFPLLQRKPALCRFAAMAGRYSEDGCRKLRPPATRGIEIKALGPLRVLAKITVAATSSSSKARLECRLDRDRWQRCPRRVVLSDLDPGGHIFRARAYRSDGTQDRTPAKARFSI